MRKFRFGMGVVLALALVGGLLASAGCSASKEESPAAITGAAAQDAQDTQDTAVQPVDVRVVALKGPTAMGMVKMMDEADAGRLTDNNYSFTISSAIDEVPPLLVKGEVDIAAVPANLSSVLYNNTKGEVTVLAINTLGVLYLVENGTTVHSLADLKGRTIYASGKGATPEYALNHVLTQGGIDPAGDVVIEWLPEHAACVAALAQNPQGIALLPQPFVATAQAQNPELSVALDLTEEWDKASADSVLITGVVVARATFVKENPQAVAAFLEHYAASVEYVNANVDAAALLVGTYDIVPEPIAKKAIPSCNIVCVTGTELKTQLGGYLAVLYGQNPESVGGALPKDDFYHLG